MKDELDVLILCGGSATDLPVQTPEFAENFCVVDSFDTHAKYLSILQMLMPQRKKAEMWESYLWVGIPECFLLTDFTETASFPRVRIILSGARA